MKVDGFIQMGDYCHGGFWRELTFNLRQHIYYRVTTGFKFMTQVLYIALLKCGGVRIRNKEVSLRGNTQPRYVNGTTK